MPVEVLTYSVTIIWPSLQISMTDLIERTLDLNSKWYIHGMNIGGEVT